MCAMRRIRSCFASFALASFFVVGSSCFVACGGANGDTTGGPGDDSGGGGNDSSSGDVGGDGPGFDVGGDAKADGGDAKTEGGTDTGVSTDTGTDGGHVIPGCGFDSDVDGITDDIEGKGKGPLGKDIDTDGDGTPDFLDLDSDNDTIPDAVEWITSGCDVPFADSNDADGDGTPNFQDLDSDANGMLDKDEACPPASMPGAPAGCTGAKPSDFEGDGVGDWVDFDNDNDGHDGKLGLEDKYEVVDGSGTYVGLIDTDGDKVFDLYDVDSDGDFIADLDDGIADPDSDGKANFRDTDSEADGVGDACEARAKAAPVAADLKLPVIDTDGDGTPDYTDKDTDADLLVDGLEDKNGNCLVDSGETDRLKADTDGDGVSDMVEVTLVSEACATDPTCTPGKLGMFYFIEPYSTDGSAAPTPTKSTLALSTTLNNGDVGFVVDTTYSMSGEISNLKSSLATTIIPALAAKIPNLGVGVAGHDDVPNNTYGDCAALPPFTSRPDTVWYQPAGFIVDVSSGGTTIPAGVTAAQTEVNGLNLGNGDDTPEAQVLALVHGIDGSAISWPAAGGCAAGSIALDDGDGGVTTFGAFHFRTKALPIIVEITDAPWHNGITAGSTTVHDAYSFSTFKSSDLVSKMNAIGAKFIGVAADNGGRAAGGPGGNPYLDEAYVTDNTGSNVATTAFTGCAAGKCCTGVSGAAIAPDGPGGTCRSVYSINTTGTGLGSSIVDGVFALLATIKFDVYVQAYNDPAATIDVVGDFMQKVEPNPAGGTDPVTGSVCVTIPLLGGMADKWTGPKAVVAGADGTNDTILGVNPGNYYCFDVVPKANTTVAATTTVQTFTAWLRVLAQKPTGGTFSLGKDRQVLFLVPPVIN